MPPELLDYSDYHRTVVGFHGTTADAADRLVAGESFQPSVNDYEWFGNGIYFWEHAYRQAWWWAKDHKKYPDPAVIGAVIRLGNCFDLLDPQNYVVLNGFYNDMIDSMKDEGVKPPVNVRNFRRLDCAMFNYVYSEFDRTGRPLDTARAVFVPSGATRFLRGAGSMPKPTSKSASGTRATSSPSGTSVKTGATARKSGAKPTGKFAVVLAKSRETTPAQRREALIRAGIITTSGELADPYKSKRSVEKAASTARSAKAPPA